MFCCNLGRYFSLVVFKKFRMFEDDWLLKYWFFGFNFGGFDLVNLEWGLGIFLVYNWFWCRSWWNMFWFLLFLVFKCLESGLLLSLIRYVWIDLMFILIGWLVLMVFILFKISYWLEGIGDLCFVIKSYCVGWFWKGDYFFC